MKYKDVHAANMNIPILKSIIKFDQDTTGENYEHEKFTLPKLDENSDKISKISHFGFEYSERLYIQIIKAREFDVYLMRLLGKFERHVRDM